MLKYITTKNPKIKKDETITQTLDIVKKKYKVVTILEGIYDEFYELLMGNNPDKLNDFIEKYDIRQGFDQGRSHP